MKTLFDYTQIAGQEKIADILRLARRLYKKKVLNLNSTYQGGGVAEILSTLVVLENNAGLNSNWNIIRGDNEFFSITKSFHNALQGESLLLTEDMIKHYLYINKLNSFYHTIDYDFVVVHDPQPLAIISNYKKSQPWIWRCHIDMSNPNEAYLDFIKDYIVRYDFAIFSHSTYMYKDFPLDYKIVPPAIDPLVAKNMPLSEDKIDFYYKKYSISKDKPLITQISRFDKWKDPQGVIEVFKLVKEEVDAQLVLCGNMAADDPEGQKIYKEILVNNKQLIEKGDLILITDEDNLLVNMLQRASDVIIQKSIREGFGLTVTEALYKGAVVVASNVGGIPLQIKDNETGFLFKPDDYTGFAKKIIEILKNPDIKYDISNKAKKYVIENFLITRLLRDYLEIFNYLLD